MKTKIELVAEAWNNHKSKEEISKEFNIKIETINYYLSTARKRGITVIKRSNAGRPVKANREESTFEKVLADWNDGILEKDIAGLYHISINTVYRYLNEARKQKRKVRIGGSENLFMENGKIIDVKAKKHTAEERQIIELLKNKFPREVAASLNISPRIVYDLIDSLSEEEKQRVKKEFIASRKLINNLIKNYKSDGLTTGQAFMEIERKESIEIKLQLADVYYILGEHKRAYKVLNQEIIDDINQRNVQRAKGRKEKIELEEKSMEIRRDYKSKKNMDGSKISYDDLCKKYNVRTNFLIQVLGQEEKDY